MSTALRVLHPDCAWCFWCVFARVYVTSTDPFFFLRVKLLIFLWLEAFNAILFHFSNDFVFLSCMNWVNKFAFTFAREMRHINALA